MKKVDASGGSNSKQKLDTRINLKKYPFPIPGTPFTYMLKNS